MRAWRTFRYQEGTYQPTTISEITSITSHPPNCPPLPYPKSWDIFDTVYTDITGNGSPECVLLVWRPWEDWPIRPWLQGPSPISANRDADGYSAHIILVVPTERGYRELWAGSALSDPLLAIAIGDVDGDGRAELIALEGDYYTGRTGPAHHVTVWRWNGFGFTLQWRSPPGRFTALQLHTCAAHPHPIILVR